MNKLSNFTIYNNWEKLNDDIGLVNEKNLPGLIEKSVKYHSKECFDILIGHPQAREWISKYPWKLTTLFKNYVNAPNTINEHYVNKVLPFIAVLNIRSMREIITNTQLFIKIFNRLEKNADVIKQLLISVICSNNVDIFKFIFNYLNTNQQQFQFFNNNWINTNVLLVCLECDNLKILKELEKSGQNLSTVNFGFTPVSSLIISLLNRTLRYGYRYRNVLSNTRGLKQNNCFEYLLSKNINTEHNLIWASVLDIDDIQDYLISYFKLNIDWPFDFTGYSNDQIDLIQQVHGIINQENLTIKLTEEPDHHDYWMWEHVINLIHYMVKSVGTVPQIQNYLTNINTIPNVDLIEKLGINMFKLLVEIDQRLSSSRYHRRRFGWKRRLNRHRAEHIIDTLEIIKYFKQNNLSNFNILNLIDTYAKVKNKSKLRLLVIYLIKLGYQMTDDFKTNVIPKIFTKTEIKNWDKNLEKSKLDDLAKQIKKNLYGYKKTGKRRNTQVLLVPGINGENEDLIEDLENHNVNVELLSDISDNSNSDEESEKSEDEEIPEPNEIDV